MPKIIASEEINLVFFSYPACLDRYPAGIGSTDLSKRTLGESLKGEMMELDLSRIDESLIDLAKEDWAKGDIEGVLIRMPNTRGLAFVSDNIPILREYGLFEKALISAYVRTRTNWSFWPFSEIRYLFSIADRKKLIEAGDPLPGDGPFTVYRGVSGRGVARRIRGISWTSSMERAIWFANRDPSLEKPAVFEAIVDKSLVLAYCEDRQESEFLCNMPRDLKLRKVWPKGGEKERK